jgi:hypothetical protein
MDNFIELLDRLRQGGASAQPFEGGWANRGFAPTQGPSLDVATSGAAGNTLGDILGTALMRVGNGELFAEGRLTPSRAPGNFRDVGPALQDAEKDFRAGYRMRF